MIAIELSQGEILETLAALAESRREDLQAAKEEIAELQARVQAIAYQRGVADRSCERLAAHIDGMEKRGIEIINALNCQTSLYNHAIDKLAVVKADRDKFMREHAAAVDRHCKDSDTWQDLFTAKDAEIARLRAELGERRSNVSRSRTQAMSSSEALKGTHNKGVFRVCDCEACQRLRAIQQAEGKA